MPAVLFREIPSKRQFWDAILALDDQSWYPKSVTPEMVGSGRKLTAAVDPFQTSTMQCVVPTADVLPVIAPSVRCL